MESIEERFRTMKPDKFLYFYQVAYPARDNVKRQYLNMNRPGSIIMDVLRLVIVLWGFMKFLIFTGPFFVYLRQYVLDVQVHLNISI